MELALYKYAIIIFIIVIVIVIVIISIIKTLQHLNESHGWKIR